MAGSVSCDQDVVIVGLGTTDYAELYAQRDPARTPEEMAVVALRSALADAGLTTADVDGLLCSGPASYVDLAWTTGMSRLRLAQGYEPTGRMSGVMLADAARALRSGDADVVALAYGTAARSAARRFGGDGLDPRYDVMAGLTSPGAYVGMMFNRYRALYGADAEALAPIAINNRRNAARNPAAVLRDPIDADEYAASPFVAEPLRRLDYCIPVDAGVALILTTAERAADLPSTPVRVLASAVATELTDRYLSRDFFGVACAGVATALRERSGLTPDDVDCVQIYDAFTPSVLFALEGLGFCERGEGWRWVAERLTGAAGELPVNTAGGHTGEGYVQGWGMLAEAVRQLRGDAGERQVDGCEVVQYACVSPITSAHLLGAAA